MIRLIILVWSFFLLTVGVCVSPVAKTQENEKAIRQQFVFYPGFRCDPAEVQGFGLGNQPLDALLAQVYVESRSEKVISAVKLGWKVYESEEGFGIANRNCEPPATPDAFLTGGTGFIDLEGLQPHERLIIGIDPLPVLQPRNRTIYVAQPFITVADVNSVVDNQKLPGKKYVIVLYVSEIRFADGGEWVMPKSARTH